MASYDVIEIVPAPDDYFDRDRPPPSDPAFDPATRPSTETMLSVVYLERASRYEEELSQAYHRIRWGGLPRSRTHPESTVRFPDQQMTLVFDSTLDQQLLMIYVYYGWPGIEAAHRSMMAASNSASSGPLHPWRLVQSFFSFTCSALSVRVQEALVDIEAACSAHIGGQLSTAATKVKDDWNRLKFKRTKISPDGTMKTRLGPSLDTPSKEYIEYWEAGDRELAGKLFEKTTPAVTTQQELRDLQAQRDHLRPAVQQYPDEVPPTGGRPGSGATHQDPNTPARQRLRAELKAVEKSLAANVPVIEAKYREVGEVLRMGPLVIPLLTPGFNQRQMEHLLGVELEKLRAALDRITTGVTTGSSRVRGLFGRWDGSQPVESYLPEGTSAEARLVKTAIADARNDPGYLPLLSEVALDAVLESGRIERDSLTYAVWAHYKLQLMRELAVERATDELIEWIVGLVNRVASLLSLASLVFPAARGARLVSNFLGFGLMAFQAYSIVHTLRMLDHEIAVALIQIETENAAYVARLGELMSMPGQYLANATSALAVELAWIVAAGAFDLFKELLHLRNYYQDVVALVEG